MGSKTFKGITGKLKPTTENTHNGPLAAVWFYWISELCKRFPVQALKNVIYISTADGKADNSVNTAKVIVNKDADAAYDQSQFLLNFRTS